MIDPNVKLIVIVGPTASGKTELSLELAERFDGEIVNADSRTIYKGMDIGTAKPSHTDQARVPHHLLDVVEPNQKLTVAEFKQLAESAVADIARRGKVPFLVGGSGLYVDSVIYDYQFPGGPSGERRAELTAMSQSQLMEVLERLDPEALEYVDVANPRRLIRAIETAGERPKRLDEPRPNTLLLGLGLNKKSSQTNIRPRIEKMLSEGLIDEVSRIGTQYGWGSEALTGIAYRAFKDVALGTKSVEQAVDDFDRGDRQLVKRQLTWFKRNQHIVWLDDPRDAQALVEAFIATN